MKRDLLQKSQQEIYLPGMGERPQDTHDVAVDTHAYANSGVAYYDAGAALRRAVDLAARHRRHRSRGLH